MIHLAHIINPIRVNESSDLYTAQPITFESMFIAQKEAKGHARIDLLTTQYPEDREIIPEGFHQLPDMERSVLDIGNFSKPKKLPLIGDILQILYKQSEAEYLIFTNVDIGLMPDFYQRVAGYIEEDLDAFIINRRRISSQYQSVNDLADIYKDKGLPHPGFDCFVFKRELLPKFRLDHICVGVPFIGVTLAYNIFAFAERFKLFDQEHLTFHIGLDVMPKRDPEYYGFNRQQFDRIYHEYLKEYLKIENIPYSNENILLRYWKWAKNPSLFVGKLMALDKKRWFKRIGF